jgi:hypothetical protein
VIGKTYWLDSKLIGALGAGAGYESSGLKSDTSGTT